MQLSAAAAAALASPQHRCGAAALVVRPPVASPSSFGGETGGKSVTVIGTWGGDEEKAFQAMVAPWETQTGITVKYTGTRDLNPVLTTGVASGILPDLAGLPGPGQMKQYAEAGALKPLDDVLDIADVQGRDRARARRASARSTASSSASSSRPPSRA